MFKKYSANVLACYSKTLTEIQFSKLRVTWLRLQIDQKFSFLNIRGNTYKKKMPRLPTNFDAQTFDPLLSALEEDDWFAPIAEKDALRGGRSKKGTTVSPEKLAMVDPTGNPYEMAITVVQARGKTMESRLKTLNDKVTKFTKLKEDKKVSNDELIKRLETRSANFKQQEILRDQMKAQKKTDDDKMRQLKMDLLSAERGGMKGGSRSTEKDIEMLLSGNYENENDEFEGGKRRKKRSSMSKKTKRRSSGRSSGRKTTTRKTRTSRKSPRRSRSGSAGTYGRRRIMKSTAGNSFYVARRADGRISKVTSVGKSLSADRRVKSKRKVKSGFGGQGDIKK